MKPEFAVKFFSIFMGCITLMPISLAAEDGVLSGFLSYERALRIATNENPLIQGLKLRTSGEELRLGHLTRSFVPRIIGSAGYEQFREGDFYGGKTFYGILGILNLYSGGMDVAENDSRNARFRLARATVTQRQIDLQRETSEAYLAAFYASKRIQVLRALRVEVERLGKSADRRVRSGISTPTDLLEFTIYRKKLIQEETVAAVAFAQAKVNLASALGFNETSKDLKLDSTIPHLHWNDQPISSEEASAWTEDLKNAASEIALAEATRAETWWRPRVDLYSSYGRDALSDQVSGPEGPIYNEWTSGLRISIPLFDGFNNYREYRSQKLISDADKLVARNNQLNQRAVLKNLVLELEQNDTLLHSAMEIEDLTRKYLRQTQNEYERGVKNSLDAHSSFQRLKDAQYDVLSLEEKYAAGRAQLEVARKSQ